MRRVRVRTSHHRKSSEKVVDSMALQRNLVSDATDALEVTFCAVQRVRDRYFVLLCTTSSWRLFRLDGFCAARESCSPVQLMMDPNKDAAQLTGVRFFHLFEFPTDVGSVDAMGALFVTNRSCLLAEDDNEYVTSEAEINDNNGHEDITVLSLDTQQVMHKLPPSPSLILDIQTNATIAAVLCETLEIFLYDLATFQLQFSILAASPAMALGPRWLAYPGITQSINTMQANEQDQMYFGREDSDSDYDDVSMDALMTGGITGDARNESHSSSPAYTAIDVAQNVASGLYYLSEVGRATIAPYLSSPPGMKLNITRSTSESMTGRCNSLGNNHELSNVRTQKTTFSNDASKQQLGWVIVLDFVTKRVMANFSCHATALVNLSLDHSGLLLATSSTKGQNLHVYRLAPPLQSVARQSKGVSVGKNGTLQCQLMYKLQRGITHASIQNIAFSQDSKWINVTSAHGTSHLYALHPEGSRISADTHANTVEKAVVSNVDDHGEEFLHQHVSDFYADYRALETRTQTQVLRIRHELKTSSKSTLELFKSKSPTLSKTSKTRSFSMASSSSLSSTSSSSSPPGQVAHSPRKGGSLRGSSFMESAIDASQALLSQLATSAIDFSHQHFEYDTDVASRRRRLRQRLCCLFAPDGLKMLICCDSTLKMYDMRITALSKHKADHARALSLDPKTKSSKSSLSSFGFEASVRELKSWRLLFPGRRKSEFLVPAIEGFSCSTTGRKPSTKSELRTFAQRSLPLWAHPKVTFKAIDEAHPDGQILEVRRRGPSSSHDLRTSTTAMAFEGYAHGDENLFAMEMDSYFGLGDSPVLDHNNTNDSTTTEILSPRDLAANINMAMSSSLPKTPPTLKPEKKNTICYGPIDSETPSSVGNGTVVTRKGKKLAKNRRILTPAPLVKHEVIEEGSSSGGLASLQFSMQDMYFAVPKEEAGI
ncbi:hypothetical protein CCR75_007098 [Bremia lactucae]|uniref:BCAS3 WD40 domain-containing protein n=1 Tax=Bremia lactucae TaxID=4779 RepID=A0A976FSC7_BRELC|nr:hypothetical protein CCR75_007098 [Bremia lactucae]